MIMMHSCSKSCAEVMSRRMVHSRVPLCSKLHKMLRNMVSVEQSKKQSIAAGSIRKARRGDSWAKALVFARRMRLRGSLVCCVV